MMNRVNRVLVKGMLCYIAGQVSTGWVSTVWAILAAIFFIVTIFVLFSRDYD
jgi:hypothetical protein